MNSDLYSIRIKVAGINEAYDWVLSDLDALEGMVDNLIKEYPSPASAIRDELYLQTNMIQAMIISQLEYLLKSLGKIQKQHEIKDAILSSKVINHKEKKHLLYLFFVRHTINHNAAHPDGKFEKNIKEYIKQLPIGSTNKHSLTTISPDVLKFYFKLIRKFILLELAGNSLTEEEKRIIEESMK